MVALSGEDALRTDTRQAVLESRPSLVIVVAPQVWPAGPADKAARLTASCADFLALESKAYVVVVKPSAQEGWSHSVDPACESVSAPKSSDQLRLEVDDAKVVGAAM